jgi:hypothetical protein
MDRQKQRVASAAAGAQRTFLQAVHPQTKREDTEESLDAADPDHQTAAAPLQQQMSQVGAPVADTVVAPWVAAGMGSKVRAGYRQASSGINHMLS